MSNVTPFAMLRIVVLLSLAFRCTASDAVGLGPMRLQSALGQPLRASVQVLGADARSLSESCVRSRLTSSDGSEILRPAVALRRPATGETEIFFTSPTSIEEPAVTLLVEIVCAPTLYRDYQLLLDLKDGLPRVLSTGSPESRGNSRRRTQSREPLALPGGDGSASSSGGEAPAKPKRKRKPRVQPAVANLSPGAGEPDNLQVLEEPKVPRERPIGLPGARNVLKLSQEGVSFGAGPKGPSGLKLSDNLTISEQPGISNSEEIVASKARFAAMMRGEDPVLAAQNEVKALQNRLQQAQAQSRVASGSTVPTTPAPSAVPATAPASVPAPVAIPKVVVKPSTPATFSNTPTANKWLIGLAVVLLACIAGVSLLARFTKRKTEKKSNPWWLSSSDSAGRETELVMAARSSVEKKATPVQAARTADEAVAHQEKAVETYVDRFIGKKELETASRERIEPQALEMEPIAEEPKAPIIVAAVAANTQRMESMHDTEFTTPSRASLATFELVSDVMQEAEFWKMLNETQRAIDILENYCTTESAASPVPWLYLADLYRDNDDMDSLEKLGQQFQQVFNGRFEQDADDTGQPRFSLEDYPHVLGRISELWGQEDVLAYLQSLLVNDRDGPREGFHLPVYREILLLIEVALEREKSIA